MVAPLFQDPVGTGEYAPRRLDVALDVVAADLVAGLTLTDYDAEGAPLPDDLRRIAVPLAEVLGDELDGASRHLRVPAPEILLAALARTVARTVGGGTLAVDVTVEDTATVHGVGLTCAAPAQTDATGMLGAVRAAVATAPALRLAQVAFSYTASSRRAEVLPGPGHALELRVYRDAGVVRLDWWYDTRQFEDYTVEELAEQFPLALIEITSEAVPTALGIV